MRGVAGAMVRGAGGVLGSVGMFMFWIAAAFPMLLAFQYVWDNTLEWPVWIAAVVVLLAIFGVVEPLVICSAIGVVVCLIHWEWWPALVLVLAFTVWPLLVQSLFWGVMMLVARVKEG